MARGCLDECDGCGCSCDCGCMESIKTRRNFISASLAGILFAVGWCFLIDGTVMSNIDNKFQAIGVMSTIGLFMVNAVSNDQLSGGDMYDGGRCGPAAIKVWFIIGLVLSFGALIGACWVMAEYFRDEIPDNTYGGTALFLQNLLIFLASLIYKFGRTDESW
eukprot:m.357400 g.357400  ORF g.357400 m.357400 type:complete len:162 (-) comp17814_c0_seq1:288-773(-)